MKINACTVCKNAPRATWITRCKQCNAAYMRNRRAANGAKPRARRIPENRALITPEARKAITAAAIGEHETVAQFVARGGKIKAIPHGATALEC